MGAGSAPMEGSAQGVSSPGGCQRLSSSGNTPKKISVGWAEPRPKTRKGCCSSWPTIGCRRRCRARARWPYCRSNSASIARIFRSDLGLVVQNHAQQGIMDFQFSVVFDEAQFAEFVHEEAHARSGRADHLG